MNNDDNTNEQNDNHNDHELSSTYGPIGLLVVGSVPFIVVFLVSDWFQHNHYWILVVVLACIFVGSIISIDVDNSTSNTSSSSSSSSSKMDFNSNENDEMNQLLSSSSSPTTTTVGSGANLFFKKRYKTMEPQDIVDDMKFQIDQLNHKWKQQQENKKKLKETNESKNNKNDVVKNENGNIYISTQNNNNNNNNAQYQWRRFVLLRGIQELASKYRSLAGTYPDSKSSVMSSSTSTSSTSSSNSSDDHRYILSKIALVCQEAAYLGLDDDVFSNNQNVMNDNNTVIIDTTTTDAMETTDTNTVTSAVNHKNGHGHGHDHDHHYYHDDYTNEIISASFTLLTLIAKDCTVRERHINEADIYGFNKVIDCMKKSLNRAITIANSISSNCSSTSTNNDDDDNNNNNKLQQQEQSFATIQQKGCLLVGALADGDPNIARRICEEGGLQAISSGMDWYRFHKYVIMWGLWCTFTILYEYPTISKIIFIRDCDGINITIRCLTEFCPDDIEITRHGIALLFDLLRDPNSDTTPSSTNSNNTGEIIGRGLPTLDIWKVRNAAIASGLHDVVINAITAFHNNTDASDIVMMGYQLLQGTNYQGPTTVLEGVPSF